MSTTANNTASAPRWHAVLLTGAAAGLVAVIPLFVYLRYQAYALWRSDVLTVVLVAAGAGLLLGAASAGSRRLAPVVLAALATLLCDFQLSPAADVAGVPEPVVLGLVFALLWGLLALLGERGPWVVLWVSVTILLSTFLRPAGELIRRDGSDRAGSSDRPFMLHLILDEQMAPAGLPRAETGTLAEDLRAFYRERGFVIPEPTHSHYRHTAESLAHILNLAPSEPLSAFLETGGTRARHTLGRSSYFDALAAMGYVASIYQTDWVDLCRAFTPPGRCTTYAATRLGWTRGVELPQQDRVALVTSTFLERSWLWNGLTGGARRGYRVSHLTAAEMVHDLSARLARAERGQFVLAHVLLPHDPYAYDRSCGLRPTPHWLGTDADQLDVGVSTSEARASRYADYAEQVRCTTLFVGQLLDALPDSVRADAVVIVHGDHGSRNAVHAPSAENLPLLTDADYWDGFSTLFAARAPGLSFPDGAAVSSVACALRALVSGQFRSLAPQAACPGNGRVQLRTENGEFIERPLPALPAGS